jgi:hypothetical protein
LTTDQTNASTGGVVASTVSQQTDNTQFSPLAQMLTTLQNLQQSNPTEYQQVTQQIATNLTSAAATAQADGNTTAATQLNQLATDFANSSQGGQLPNIQDLALAVGGHHHEHHHHAPGAASESDTNSSANSSLTSTTNSANTSQITSQLQSAIQANGAPSDALNPVSIILNTLSQAGVDVNSPSQPVTQNSPSQMSLYQQGLVSATDMWLGPVAATGPGNPVYSPQAMLSGSPAGVVGEY